MQDGKITRNTLQRKVILEELRKVKVHPTADATFQLVKNKLPNISLATVYRNLEFLANSGEISRLDLPGELKRFDGNNVPHDHIRCKVCGRIDDFDVTSSPELVSALMEKTNYQITSYHVSFVGICPICQKRK